MIEGFPLETAPLNKYERETILPRMVSGLRAANCKENRVTSSRIVRSMKKEGYTIAPARVRKIIHHIRVNDLVERLVASNQGYWIEHDNSEFEKYILSRKERQKAEGLATAALERQLLKSKQMSLI